MKLSDGIKVFSFSIEKVWKMVFEKVWEPCSMSLRGCWPCSLLQRKRFGGKGVLLHLPTLLSHSDLLIGC